MNTSSTQTFFSDLPRHAKLKVIGEAIVQTGLFLIAVSAVLKRLGQSEAPVSSTIFTETTSQHSNTRGYFD